MKLKNYNYLVNLSGDKVAKTISRIEAEKLMCVLASPNKPQFVLLGEQLVNTSFIISITISPMDLYEPIQEKELSSYEAKIHDKYLSLKELPLEDIKRLPSKNGQ